MLFWCCVGGILGCIGGWLLNRVMGEPDYDWSTGLWTPQ